VDDFGLRTLASLRLPLPMWASLFLCAVEAEGGAPGVGSNLEGRGEAARVWRARTHGSAGVVVTALGAAALLRFPDAVGLPSVWMR
jgi:hypothetical protein